MSIIKGAMFGIQGMLDQAMASTFQKGLSGVWGLTSGLAKGVAGLDSGLHNKTLLGKVTGGLGYGVGKTAGIVARPIAKGAGAFGAGFVKSIPNDLKRSVEVSQSLFKAVTREAIDGADDLGIGIGGRHVKRRVAWGLTAGAVAVGSMGAAEDHAYNFGLKTAVNGMMNTEGVAVTPGSVSPSYIPAHRGRPINDHGASGALGLALHNGRRGQING